MNKNKTADGILTWLVLIFVCVFGFSALGALVVLLLVPVALIALIVTGFSSGPAWENTPSTSVVPDTIPEDWN